jgi:hypothetical protein
MTEDVDRDIAATERLIAYHQKKLKGYQERRRMFDDVLNLWVEGATVGKIAEELGVYRGMVTSVVYRARKKGDPRAIWHS